MHSENYLARYMYYLQLNENSLHTYSKVPTFKVSSSLCVIEVARKIFICSLDAVCRALRPKKIFLAFEGHKGRKAKKGQNFPKNKYGSKCLKLPNSARNPIKKFSPL